MLRHPILVVLALAAAVPAAASEVRRFELVYRTRVTLEPGAGPVELFVPLPVENGAQRILGEEVEASIPGRVETEPRYGNRFWRGSTDAADAPIEVVLRARIERRALHREPPDRGAARLGPAERVKYARFLQPNERVVVDHEILEPILTEVRTAAPEDDPALRARAIYDWVVDNVQYKKVGTGWGHGDSFWACTERYGNCTDFHSLFISLARSEDIPARFEMGLPVPTDAPSGEIGGYHCWVEFYLPGSGWIPIDASEAFKHPERRELYYGSHPADRVHFTTGRDLRLGDAHEDAPLNYFIFPYVEVGGRRVEDGIERSIEYRELAPPAS